MELFILLPIQWHTLLATLPFTILSQQPLHRTPIPAFSNLQLKIATLRPKAVQELLLIQQLMLPTITKSQLLQKLFRLVLPHLGLLRLNVVGWTATKSTSAISAKSKTALIMPSAMTIRITSTLSKSVIAQSTSRASQASGILQIRLLPRTGWLLLIKVMQIQSHMTPQSSRSLILSMMMIVDPPNVGYHRKVAF